MIRSSIGLEHPALTRKVSGSCPLGSTNMKSEEKYQQFKELHDKGLSYTEIAKQCNSTKSLVAYYLGSR